MSRAPHICHVTVGHKPTDDRIYYKEACSLAQAGYHVTIVAPAIPEPLPRIENIHWRLFTPGRYWHNLVSAYRRAKTVKADLYHLHEFELLPFGWILKYKYRRKVIYDAHESVFYFFLDFSRRSWIVRFILGFLAQSLEYIGIRGCDYLITVTPWVEAHLRRFHPRRAIVYNYPVLNLFSPAEPVGHQPLILYPGQLVPGRNIELMIAAMPQVVQTIPEARLLLVGGVSPDYRRYLENLIIKYQVTEKVHILPPVAYERIPELMAQASIGLAALQLNESYRRSIQVKPLEFMAMEIPVLGARVPSIVQYVVNEGAGLIVEPLTPTNLAHHIITLWQNPTMRRQMGQRGRQAVEMKYNWEATRPTLLAVYRSLLPC